MWNKPQLLNAIADLLMLVAAAALLAAAAVWLVRVPSLPVRHVVFVEALPHTKRAEVEQVLLVALKGNFFSLNLEGVRFTQGVEFDFTGGAITSLPAGGRVLVVRDLAAFQAAYGTNRPVAGVFANGTALSNSGESLKLEDANSDTIREFAYSDEVPWPTDADAGYSLVLLAPETIPDPSVDQPL